MLSKPKKKIDRCSYEWALSVNQGRLEWLRKSLAGFDTDPDKAERLKAAECKCCFYTTRPRMHCQAFHETECGICGEQIVSSTSDIGVVCKPCATERGLCSKCGGDLNDKKRRKVDLSHKEGEDARSTK